MARVYRSRSGKSEQERDAARTGVRLCFRAPGRAWDAATLVGRAAPGLAPAGVAALLAGGRLQELRPARRGARVVARVKAGARVAPGTLLRLELSARDAALGVAFLGQRTQAISGEWLGVAPEPAWPEAHRRLGGGEISVRRGACRAGLARLEIALDGTLRRVDVLELAAHLGAPLLGDVERGGFLVEGGLQLAPAADGEPKLTWPREPVFAPDARAGGGRLVVSAATARALARGHPWILPDAATGDPGRFRAGALVEVGPTRGPCSGLARVEGVGPVAARMWAAGVRRPRDAPSVEARVHAALGRRTRLLEGARAGDPTALRLIHGEADGLPGLAVDRLGEMLRVLVTGRAALGLRARAVLALEGALGPAAGVVEVVHLQPTPPRVRLRAVRVVSGRLEPGRLPVREAGLTYLVDPGLGAPERPRPGVGLFLDQRANRARLRARVAPGGRYLNLFAHTGAFSLALLQGGAREVVSVDLSAPYLAWLEQNLAANGDRLDATRHRAVQGDARRFVESLPPQERFDGIVLDPPTAAAVGRRYWSAAQGLEDLTARAFRHLAPGGWLLVCRNERRPRRRLAEQVERAARASERRLEALDPAPPGDDFPTLPGFPEGDPFEGVLATLSAR